MTKVAQRRHPGADQAQRKTRFLIFGGGRSGSTLLSRLLDSHPDIRCERELFNPGNGYLANGLFLDVLRFVPYPYIMWRSARAGAQAYGFKLMLGHVHAPRLALNVLALLGWRILHIQRQSLADQALSELVSLRTGRWQRTRGESAASPRIRLEREDFLNELRRMREGRLIEQRALAGIAHHDVVYERDLADPGSWPETSTAVCRYLGVADRRLTANLVKVYDEPYATIVENYDELIAAAR
jgi:hypothetical protein